MTQLEDEEYTLYEELISQGYINEPGVHNE
jgi:hypothetical protein